MIVVAKQHRQRQKQRTTTTKDRTIKIQNSSNIPCKCCKKLSIFKQYTWGGTLSFRILWDPCRRDSSVRLAAGLWPGTLVSPEMAELGFQSLSDHLYLELRIMFIPRYNNITVTNVLSQCRGWTQINWGCLGHCELTCGVRMQRS